MPRKVVDGAVSARIGLFIKKHREACGLTQAALGRELGYRYGNFIAMLEGHNASFPVSKWKEYADALNVPREKFLKLVLSEVYPDMMPYLVVKDRAAAAETRTETETSNEAPEEPEQATTR